MNTKKDELETSRHTTRTGSTTSAGFGEAPSLRWYFELLDTLSGSGCPLCTRVLAAGCEALTGLLPARLSGRGPQATVLDFRGLCNLHAWALRDFADAPVGLAQAYERFLRGQRDRFQRSAERPLSALRRVWRRLVGWCRPRRCPACRAAQRAERRDLRLLLDLITDMEFARAFERSAGLCLPHLNLAFRISPGHPNLRTLLEAHFPKMKNLEAELQDFIRRAKAPIATVTPVEQHTLWGRVLEQAAGKPGAFGHERDLALERQGLLEALWSVKRGIHPASRMAPGGTDAVAPNETERLRLENAKLQRRLVEVTREWAEESSRRAALQYQVHKLSEDVRVMELNVAGARGEAQSGERQTARLREEIRDLQSEIERLRALQRNAGGGIGGVTHECDPE
jgi:hypothetical protein